MSPEVMETTAPASFRSFRMVLISAIALECSIGFDLLSGLGDGWGRAG